MTRHYRIDLEAARDLAFASATIKQATSRLSESPFQLAFVADIDVEIVNEKPALCKILDSKDELEKPA